MATPDSDPAQDCEPAINFRKLIENSFSGITLFDAGYRVIYRSRSARRIVGWDDDGRTGQSLKDLVHPGDLDVVLRLLQAVKLDANKPQTISFRNKHANGQYNWLEATFTNMLQEPDVNAIVCNFLDITERMRSQEQLVESERFVKTITDHLPALIAYFSADLRCLFANLPYTEWFGIQGRPVIGRLKQDFVDAEEFASQQEHLRQVLAGVPQRFGRVLVSCHGQSLDTYTQYLPDWKDGQVRGFYSLIYDVSDVKAAEGRVLQKAAEMGELLESINDGFATIDKDMRYTYVNGHMCNMLGLLPAQMVGRRFPEVLPGTVCTATYRALQQSMQDGSYVCLEDYYAPQQMWQEVRVYPMPDGASVFIRDISGRKQADEQIRQSNARFSLIAKATQDALFEWNHQTNEIWWSETHYTMFGFDPAAPMPTREAWLEKIHPQSRILMVEILNDIFHKGLRNWQHEVIYLRPDKSWGTLLMRGFVVLDTRDKPARSLGCFMDITIRKNEENQKELFTGISQLFREKTSLPFILPRVAAKMRLYSSCAVTEIWTLTADRERLVLTGKDEDQIRQQVLFGLGGDDFSFVKGLGLPGTTWERKAVQFWKYSDPQAPFVRRGQAEGSGLKSALAIPICHDDEVLGVMVMRFEVDENPLSASGALFEALGTHIGMEIKHHQLEQQLWLLFNRTADVICIIGTDRYFKEVNPAMTVLLEYSGEELLGMSLDDVLHRDDMETSRLRTQKFIAGGEQTVYFENRFVSRSGKVIWFSWTASKRAEDGILFCVGKDISDKKDLENLLNKANELARIGGWEIDFIKNKVYWSPITREIHEVDAGFEPDIETAAGFYHDGDDRRQLFERVNEAIASGQPCDIELQIVTTKGNIKWIRVIAEAVYQDGRCVRVRGSFQDIDTRKRAEITALAALEEKNAILESIGDGFFAVDRNWITTYWNAAAEKAMSRPREAMLGKYFWELYPDVVQLESYRQYTHAIDTGEAVHFEDYYPPLATWYGVNAYPSENGLSVFFRDITEGKKTMQALEESQKRYSDLFQLSPQPMFVYDMATLGFLDVNIAAVQHYGFSHGEFLEMTLHDIRPQEDIPLLEATVAELQDSKSVKQHGIFRHRKKNGDLIQVEILSNIIEYQGIRAKVVLANDVTGQLKYIKTIEAQNKKLKEISWMQSHVVRAPLSRIMGLVDLLNMAEHDAAEQETIRNYIITSANELDAAIRSITATGEIQMA